jgi:putative MATE family efflux protein
MENAKVTIWTELKNAIKGTDADYTKVSLKRAIFLLAVPMILELVMESTFAVADIFFVGKLGASAIATVGLTETLLFLLYAVAMGLSMAVTAIIARRVGEKDMRSASISAVQAILVGVFISLPFTIAGLFYAKELLTLMGADNWTLTTGYTYTQWMLGGNVVIILLFVINAIYRGAGDAAIAMRVLWIANGINILFDPILIFGWGPFPAYGIEGAAMATNLGRGVGVFLQFWVLFKGGKHLKVTLAQWRFNLAIMLNLLKTSLGGMAQMLVAMTSWIFLMRILANIGSEAVAGATIAIRIMMFTIMPAWGLSNAAATLVGQNLGADNPQRAEDTVWKIGFYNMGFLILVSICFFIFNTQLMAIFTQDATVISIGATWLKILSYSFFVYGWWMVSVQAFNGAGDTKTPTYINLVFFWLIQIPLAYFLAIYLDYKHQGVFWAVFISETSVGLFTLWLFKKGKWKTMKV